MHFTTLRLKQFRNYPYLELEPSEGITVLYGPNGSGKTNLLEAMHLLSLGRSHRTTADREMVAQGEAAALVHGETRRLDGRHEIEIRLTPMEKPQKRVLLYGKPAQRIADLMGHGGLLICIPRISGPANSGGCKPTRWYGKAATRCCGRISCRASAISPISWTRGTSS